jgi:HlyD family secretion protein
MKKVLIYVVAIGLVAVALLFALGPKNGQGPSYKLVPVEEGAIAEKALAVGTIEPDKEIKVKSAISGIISDIYFKTGDSAEKGAPLFKISPNPTPLAYAEARRNMEIAEVGLKQAQRERDRKNSLFKDQLISRSDMDGVDTHLEEVQLRYKIALEKFKLLEKGRIKMSGKNIDSIIKSPISGIVLTRDVEEGDPVVPLTNFQPGTELCAMADMGTMLFKGTVDEIDVGKLNPGMDVEIKVGALPGAGVTGKLDRISPKARKDGNATLFDIEVLILKSSGKTLRAGYSATAYVKIKENKNVLVIPERLVTFEKEKRFVEIKEGEVIKKVEIKTGLSDSLNIEVVEGLKKGDKVVERPPREIT